MLGGFPFTPVMSLMTMLVAVTSVLPLGSRAGQALKIGFLRHSEGMVRPGVKPRLGSVVCGAATDRTGEASRRSILGTASHMAGRRLKR